MTNTQKLSKYGGGTDCSSPIRFANENKWKVDNFILVSDNESWVGRGGMGHTAYEWTKLRNRCPNAKLVNIDLQPYGTTQVKDQKSEVLNCGGFSDSLWTIIDNFLNREENKNFVEVIENYISL
jgi:60 kDa SS-A/Ro ribonucleoprotein